MEEMFQLNPPAEDLHGLIAAAARHNRRRMMTTEFTTTMSSGSTDLYNNDEEEEEEKEEEELKARIASHPRYPSLLQAYVDCQKVPFHSSLFNY